jgi:hypothetical protein
MRLADEDAEGLLVARPQPAQEVPFILSLPDLANGCVPHDLDDIPPPVCPRSRTLAAAALETPVKQRVFSTSHA